MSAAGSGGEATCAHSRDWKILKWLMGYARPYRRQFTLALLLMFAASALELVVPYLTKTAVDAYISPPWRMAHVEDGPGAAVLNGEAEAGGPGTAIALGGGRYLINIERLDKGRKKELEKRGILSGEPYVVIRPEAAPAERRASIERIVAENASLFRRAGGVYYAPLSALGGLERTEVAVLRHDDLRRVSVVAGLLLLCLVGAFAASTAFTYLLQYSGQKIMHTIRTDAVEHLLRLEQPFFDKTPLGRLVTRITNDANAINEVYTSVVVQFLKDLLIIVGVLALMFYMNAYLTLLILGLTLVLALLAVRFKSTLRRAYRNVRRSIGRLNAFVQECVDGITLIKLHMREAENFERFKQRSRENFEANMQQVLAFATFRPLIEFVSIAAVALILWYGGLSVLRFELTLGALLAYLVYIRMLFAPILEMAEKYNIFQSAIAASENLYDLYTVEPERSGGIGDGERSRHARRIEGRIEFRDVWFSYDGREWVLKGVSFTLEPRSTLAIVGPTGSGKSTIVNLLLRFYEPQRGEITVDGVPIERYDPRYLRSQISTVFQDMPLVGSVEEENGSSDDGVPSGLSSGQRQLLAIRRALDRGFKVLIMDEATSHVDGRIEMETVTMLKEKAREAAVLVVAHRLSTVTHADHIVVLHGGKVIEEGTHEELLSKRGMYYDLYTLQNRTRSAA